nr:hypothetical protein [Tanacetum cinerariifolium]
MKAAFLNSGGGGKKINKQGAQAIRNKKNTDGSFGSTLDSGLLSLVDVTGIVHVQDSGLTVGNTVTSGAIGQNPSNTGPILVTNSLTPKLINDMHTIGMTMQQVQVNTKFLNALLPEWSKFVTDVKLAKSFYTTNYDQLYAYLSQNEGHVNEARIMHERYPNPLSLVANSQTLYNPSQTPQHSGSSMYPPP